MTPHSYSLDSHTKSTELAGKLLAAVTPPEISAVISHLTRNIADQKRHFFSLAFPTLISKLFGFSDDVISSSQKPPSWIDTASFDAELAVGYLDRPKFPSCVVEANFFYTVEKSSYEVVSKNAK